jgi:MFS family permease
MAAALVPRELTSWSLLALAMGSLEGGLLGVIVKNQFASAASPTVVNLAVAVVAGAAAFTNLLSFFFAARALGRGKVPLLSRLMFGIGACLLAMALMPRSAWGLFGFVLLTVGAAACWSGILTVRAVVWRANYPRNWRGQVAARISQLASFLTAAFSALVGFAMNTSGSAWRMLFPLAALCALAGGRVYRRQRVRRHARLMQEENTRQAGGLRLSSMLGVLRSNRDFRNYMLAMMVFGSGNLMVIPMLVVLMTDRLGMDRLSQVMLTSSLPVLVLCLSVRAWAVLLDRRHIVSYRVVHSWTFVAANALFAAALIGSTPWLLWVGSVLLGLAWGGGHLGWNLGHNDFASDGDSSLYMATHVGLTGLRGLFMPLLGVVLILGLEALAPGHGAWAMLVPLLLTLLGWTGFVRLHRELAGRPSAEAVAGR